MSVSFQFTAITTNARIKPDAQIRGQLNQYLAGFVGEVLRVMYVYPPAPPWSTYERTFTLRKSWRVRPLVDGDRLGFIIWNRAKEGPQHRYNYGREYAGLVVGRRQTWFHRRTGWRTLPDVVDDLGGRGRLKRGVQAVFSAATSEFRR